jgi:hypothetical protein
VPRPVDVPRPVSLFYFKLQSFTLVF